MEYPFDYIEHGYVSECCGANVIHGDICMDCKDHCDLVEEDEEED